MYKSITSLLETATTQGYRSNVVKPLTGMSVILLVATAVLFYFQVPIFGYIVGSLAVILIVVFIISYVYCLVKNPDLLRSERYNLEKTAMEKVAVSGDSMSGQLQLSQRDFVMITSNSETIDNREAQQGGND